MDVTILATSDVHGYIYPTNFNTRNQNQPFGLAKLATLIEEIKSSANGPVVTIDNGDFLQGSPLTYFVAKHPELDQKKVLMEAFNLAHYDVSIIGNHEFNYGRDYLEDALSYMKHPVLAANIIDEQTQKSFVEPFTIIEQDGIKIAVLGLTTNYIPNWEHPDHIQHLRFDNIVETAKKYVPELRKQADIVVVSYHGGFERDLLSGEPTEFLTGENEAYRLLMEVSGIDALVTGHQHREIATMLNGVPVIQPGSKGTFLGKIVLKVEKNESGNYQVMSASSSLERIGEEKLDVPLANHMSALQETVETWLDQPIGKTVGSMVITDPHEARIKEHPYIEFIQKVQMDASGVAISGTALFNNDGQGFAENITMRDIVTNYIYPNTLAVLNITGADLRAALEQTAEFFTILPDGTIGVEPRFMDPKPQLYNYDMYEGIDYTIDVAKPVGQRITSLSFRGEEVKDDHRYEVVMNQYRAVGGGNYKMFSADKIVREIQTDMTELIADYLTKHPLLESSTNDNFNVIIGE